MYKSNCYNYEWFVDWLKRNLKENLIPQYTRTAADIAQKFKRLYFEVSVEDVKHAMEEIGFSYTIKNGEYLYSVSFTEEATKAIWKTWE